MRIEEQFGNRILCGPGYVEVEANTRWQSSNGSIARVTMVSGNNITYYMEAYPEYTYDRDYFGFQTRFCKIVEHD